MPSVAAQMFTALCENPEALVAYQDDFLVHDLAMIAKVAKGQQFVWVVRDHGTHLWELDGKESSYARAVLESTGGGIKFVKHIVVTRGTPEGPDAMDQRGADASFADISRGDALVLLRKPVLK